MSVLMEDLREELLDRMDGLQLRLQVSRVGGSGLHWGVCSHLAIQKHQRLPSSEPTRPATYVQHGQLASRHQKESTSRVLMLSISDVMRPTLQTKIG